MLILGRKAGESLTIGGDISITVLSVDSGGNVSLGIQPGGRPEPLYPTAPRVSGVCVPQGGGCNPAVGSAQMILKDWRQVE